DPDFVRPAVLRTVTSKEYAVARRKEINPARAAKQYKAGTIDGHTPTAGDDDEPSLAGRDLGDTIYLTCADGKGNIVSLIQSLFSDFGSGIVAGDTGIVLQNRGSLFNLKPGHPDQIGPHKRPRQTLLAAFVMKNGKPWLSFGVMGGDHQAQGHVQVLVNLIDFGMNIQEAGEAARVTHGTIHGATGVQLESAIGSTVREELAKRGHRILAGGSFGGFQGIWI